MITEIHASGLTLTDALRQRIHSRLAAALRPFARAVSRITARLSDVNARRGGIDKRVTLLASLPGRQPVFVESLHADPLASVDHAAARIRAALRHSLAPRSHKRRRTYGFPATGPTAA